MRAGVPAGLGRCWAGRFGAGFGLYVTLTAKRQASGRKSSSFRPFSLRALLLPLRMSSRSPAGSVCSIWAGKLAAEGRRAACPSGRGSGRVVRLLRHGAGLAALVPCLLSVSPAGRAGAVRAGAGAGAGHGRQSQANRLANRQNAQRFNKKCSIMTKIMPCILCFLRCKYACFGVK